MPEVAIIGAGLAGIATAVRLHEAGIDDIVILEKGDGAGGVWRENTYPGVAVDIPSISYQYAFDRKPDWSRIFATGDEVLKYHLDIARKYGIDRYMRFDVNVVSERFDDDTHQWHLNTAAGETITARFVISAKGPFVGPKTEVGIRGIGSFRGKIQRPAEWDHGYDYRGKRVAIIGTGASSIQITPSIAPDVEQLKVFQRTPTWVFPKPDALVPGWAKQALRVPGVSAGLHNSLLLGMQALTSAILAPLVVAGPIMITLDTAVKALYRTYLGVVVDDPADQKALMPRFGFVAKRPTLSSQFLQTFNRENTELITTPIECVVPEGVRTVDGEVHAVDMLVVAVGYDMHSDHTSYPPGMIVGRNGFDQGEFYAREGVQAYESVAVAGVPNRWMTSGPFCWQGFTWHGVVDVTITHIVRAISEGRRRGATLVEVSREAHDRHHAEIKRRRKNFERYFKAQQAKGANTYLMNPQGECATIRPTRPLEARHRAQTFSFDDYIFERVENPAPNRVESDVEEVTA